MTSLPNLTRIPPLLAVFAGIVTTAMMLTFADVTSAAPDPWLTGMVKVSLLSQLPSGLGVDVDTFDGRVTLHGKVGTELERLDAERLARGVNGVRAVRNLLQVVPTSRRSVVEVADDRLTQRVAVKLKGDRALSNSSIAVKSVNAGVVLLHGHAHTLSDHLRALELTSRVPGVQRVASEIESPEAFADNDLWYGDAPPRGTASRALHDAWVTSRIRLKLMADPEVPANDISVDTESGRVTLFGVVPSLAARDAAAAAARGTGGVLSVKNDLRIVAPTEHSRIRAEDRELESIVQSRLVASGFPQGIDVDVKAGVGRVSGKVNSWADRYAVLTVARSTEGVRAIRDDLIVTGTP